MEKLIEFLNEFQKEKKSQIFYSYNRDLDFFESWAIAWCQIYWESVYTIISKKYGFIQWLVDNDKIDYKKDWKNSNDTWYIYVKADTKKSDLEIKSDTLLMVLAIEDNPIEFLISILK